MPVRRLPDRPWKAKPERCICSQSFPLCYDIVPAACGTGEIEVAYCRRHGMRTHMGMPVFPMMFMQL